MATCSSCHAPILWAVAEATGRSMPLNAAPDPVDGNVEVIPGAAGARLPTARVHAQRPMFTEHPTHTSHFATCPYAADHRKH